MPLKEWVERTATLLAASEQLDDAAVVDRLVAEGSDRTMAWQLVTFVPLAFCRAMLMPANVRFAPTYRSAQGESKPIADEPVYREAAALAASPASRGKGETYWVHIAGRSPEFQGINSLLLAGSRLEDLALGEPVFFGGTQRDGA
jgi:hypothetical protein